MKRLVIFSILVFLCACSSSPTKPGETTMWLPDQDGASTAEGAAYTADSMHFRKPMPSRPNWKPMEFYFKHCNEIDEKPYYSKTAYECSGP
ncbi:MAG: hypothetical protein AB7N80_01905 [Bdellovibrionales bacterium]